MTRPLYLHAGTRCSGYYDQDGNPCSGVPDETRPDPVQCSREATHWLVEPEGRPNPGGWVCEPCGRGMVAQLAGIGEEWSLSPVTPYWQLAAGGGL